MFLTLEFTISVGRDDGGATAAILARVIVRGSRWQSCAGKSRGLFDAKFRALYDDPASPCSRRTTLAQEHCCAKRLVGELAPVSIALRSEVVRATYLDVPTHLLACLHTGVMHRRCYERSANGVPTAPDSEGFRGLEVLQDGRFFESYGE